MANLVFPQFKALVLEFLLTANIKAALVSTTTGPAGSNYVASGVDQFFSAVPAGAIVAAGVTLTGVGVGLGGTGNTQGALSAGPITFQNVTAPNAGQKGEAVVFYIWTGDPATSPLIAYEDAQAGLPVIPSGLPETIEFTSAILLFN